MPDTQDSPALEDLTPEEANRIIHSHRKVRYGTACWPCRQRKVKCDNQSPCENCVRRDHAQLCSYKPAKAAATGKASVSSEGGHSKKRTHSPDEQDEGRRSQSHEARESIRAFEPDAIETSRYLGENSIPALLREQGSPDAPRQGQLEGVDTIRADMRSILGLDNSAPFPLMSSRHLNRLTQDISSELPSDREVMKLFRSYKEIPQPFWGFVIDIGELESKLMVYLEERAKNAQASSSTPTVPKRPVSASWLAVLFAVLAVGSQYHDSPYHIRTRDSQRYIQISFHFLRVGNFLLRPNFDSIQALLMTSFCLLNDMKAEASWALLGLTCRLAQSLGLHLQSSSERSGPEIERKEMVRRKLWWTCFWHDSLTSLSFDRSPMTDIQCVGIPMSPTAETEGWSYLEAMYHLCEIICRKLNPDAVAKTNYDKILQNCRDVERIREKLIPQLRNKELCRSAVDRLQFFAIRLHTSFVVSVCCRPALRRGDGDGNLLTPGEKKFLSTKCKENLTETVRMFLSMHQLSVIPTRSWAFTYHGLSSAVLLGILGETKADPEVRQLQGDLIAALSATAAKEQTSPQPHIQKTDRDIELSGPLFRALAALKSIYDHGSYVAGNVKNEIGGSASHSMPGSGARTPLAVGQLAGLVPINTGSGGADTPLGGLRPGNTGLPPGGLDPHQNAALAMAEMQQQQSGPGVGVSMHEYPNLPFNSPLPQPSMHTDFSAMDPATYMSPMDLYDSIFWEVPDPYNTGVDSMNFDFLAHPPPGQPQQQYYF